MAVLFCIVRVVLAGQFILFLELEVIERGGFGEGLIGFFNFIFLVEVESPLFEIDVGPLEVDLLVAIAGDYFFHLPLCVDIIHLHVSQHAF